MRLEMNYDDKRQSCKANLLEPLIIPSRKPGLCLISWCSLSVQLFSPEWDWPEYCSRIYNVLTSYFRLRSWRTTSCPHFLFGCIYHMSCSIGISPSCQKQTTLGEEFITKVSWILLHMEEDTHEARGFIRSLVVHRTSDLAHFHNATSLAWTGVSPWQHTFSHPVSHPLAQNNTAFHFDITILRGKEGKYHYPLTNC